MAMSSGMTVGFVGLGAMGRGMAGALLRAGFRVQGYDISAESVEALAAAGGIATGSAAEAAREPARW